MEPFESPVDCNNTQTYPKYDTEEEEFESPVDCNNTQTCTVSADVGAEFESPVDCNNTQTPVSCNMSAHCLRAL